MVETPTMSTTGRRTVIGTFLIPNTHETDIILQVSADGLYAELSYQVPPMFLYLVDRFAQEVGTNHPDATVIMAALRDVENLMLQIKITSAPLCNVVSSHFPASRIQSLTSSIWMKACSQA
jgi:hypothetical protein